MLNLVKNITPKNFRNRVFYVLPRWAKHKIVDSYIDKRVTTLEKYLSNCGDNWIENTPHWKRISAAAGKEEISEAISGFWREVSEDDEANGAKVYADSERTWDIEWLKKHVDQLLPQKAKILDFGCNAGRVLRVFVDDSYGGIGIEINPKAVEFGQRAFPSLKKAKIYVGDGTDTLKNVEQNSVNLIYSCAVLRHVSPRKIDIILAEFSRINPTYIITIEDEASLNFRNFPHNYRYKFRALGWHEIVTEYAIDVKPYFAEVGLGTMLRIYERREP